MLLMLSSYFLLNLVFINKLLNRIKNRLFKINYTQVIIYKNGSFFKQNAAKNALSNNSNIKLFTTDTYLNLK